MKKHVLNKKRNIASSLKSTVYGGLDGIITTFAIVAGVAGASLEASIVLILGFANLFADGISMAVGDYLSTKSENEYYHKNGMHNFESASPIKSGLITFTSFAVFGFIPLIAYVIRQLTLDFNYNIFLNSFQYYYVFHVPVILTGIALFSLGIVKARLTGKNKLFSGIETLLIGGITASVSYSIGYFISMIV